MATTNQQSDSEAYDGSLYNALCLAETVNDKQITMAVYYQMAACDPVKWLMGRLEPEQSKALGMTMVALAAKWGSIVHRYVHDRSWNISRKPGSSNASDREPLWIKLEKRISVCKIPIFNMSGRYDVMIEELKSNDNTGIYVTQFQKDKDEFRATLGELLG